MKDKEKIIEVLTEFKDWLDSTIKPSVCLNCDKELTNNLDDFCSESCFLDNYNQELITEKN